MGVLDWFSRRQAEPEQSSILGLRQVDDNLSVAIRQIEEEQIMKSKGNGKAKAYEEPILATFSMNPDYKDAPSSRGMFNLLDQLKIWSRKNIILNAIIN